ncbi:hypothetical protein DFQ28_000025 [Apophysomyces sp. BC1034]|nr:hypothetical protein DFQ30_005464 [Apophysomyces sp. BC1015]KAG0182785.1 hypothetical protein DFQ29_002197 [Apophysomyces sp. BC1021]KAG0194926.1 hypothetical protein DFQ28_000025 [Apophysomyces sp. BC1034]
MHNVDDSDEFDIAEDSIEGLLEAVERAETTHMNPSSPIILDDDFDDVDDDALVSMTEVAEKRRPVTSSNNNKHQNESGFQRSIMDFVDMPASVSPRRGNDAAATTSLGSRGGTSNNSSNRSPFLIPEDPVPPAPPPPGMPSFHSFDREALPTWIYPINYPIRTYQYNIVQKAMFHNTLVALPTGLGKTFIAAVVMYNYWRWFPTSKIIFVAPTRPLVAQQIEACFKICGLPQDDTVELTGSLQQEKRKLLWATKRVYFMTPQTLQNDLRDRICPADKIVCLVIDEAHKATGNYAYTEVVRKIAKSHEHFRVLALTATPGTNVDNVQAVISNLRISNVQIRTEDSMDIQEFSHGKSVKKTVVKLSYSGGATGVVPQAIATFREKIFQPVLQRLRQLQAIYDDEAERNTPFQILMARRNFMSNSKNLPQSLKGKVFVDFSIAEALSRAFELLCQHGVGPFLGSIDQTLEKMQEEVDNGKTSAKEKCNLVKNFALKNLLRDLREKSAQPGFVGHPKMDSLVHTLLQHFSTVEDDQPQEQQSKVIIFSTYRSSVDEIVKVLSAHGPLVRCSSFVGQAGAKDGTKGLNQREQKEVISKFRRGELNVLVATSIGEEGLDIGEVDLIICYDSQSSPIRMLQRMGRTGRKRQGNCVLLMTEQEERKYQNAKDAYRRVQDIIARRDTLQYYKENPCILPENYKPTCCRKTLKIGTYTKPTTGRTKKNASETDSDSKINTDGTLKEEALQSFIESFQDVGEVLTIEQVTNRHWPIQHPLKTSLKYIPLHSRLSSHKHVGHSRRTLQYANLVNKMERRILKNDDMSDHSVELSSPVDSHMVLPQRQLKLGFTGLTTNDHIIIPRRRKREYTDEEDYQLDHQKCQKLDESAPKSKLDDQYTSSHRRKHDELGQDNAECSNRKRAKMNEDESNEFWLQAGPLVTKGMLGEEDDFDSFGQMSGVNIWDLEEKQKSKEKGKQPVSTSLNMVSVPNQSPWDEYTFSDVEEIFAEHGQFGNENISNVDNGVTTDDKKEDQNTYEDADTSKFDDDLPMETREEHVDKKATDAFDKNGDLSIREKQNDTNEFDAVEMFDYDIDQPESLKQQHSNEYEVMENNCTEKRVTQQNTTEVDSDVSLDMGDNPNAFRFDDSLSPKYPYEDKKFYAQCTWDPPIFSILTLSLPVLSEGAKQVLEERQKRHKAITGRFLKYGVYTHDIPSNEDLTQKDIPRVSINRSDSISFGSDGSLLEALADIPLMQPQPTTRDSRNSIEIYDSFDDSLLEVLADASLTPPRKPEAVPSDPVRLEHDIDNTLDNNVQNEQTTAIAAPYLEPKEDYGSTYFLISDDEYEVTSQKPVEQTAINIPPTAAHEVNLDVSDGKNCILADDTELVHSCGTHDRLQISDHVYDKLVPEEVLDEGVIEFDFSGDEMLQKIMTSGVDAERESFELSIHSDHGNSNSPSNLENDDEGSILGDLAGSPEPYFQSTPPEVLQTSNDIGKDYDGTPSPVIRRVRKRAIIIDDSDDISREILKDFQCDLSSGKSLNGKDSYVEEVEDRKLRQLRPARTFSKPSSSSASDIERPVQRKVLAGVPNANMRHKKLKFGHANPFLDLEAERSSDGYSTDDGNDEDEKEDRASCMDSFINDGSSGLAPYGSPIRSSSTTTQDERSHHGDIYSVYRASLLSPDMLKSRGVKTLFDMEAGPKKKSWIDKIDTEKWEHCVNEDEESDHDDEEEIEGDISHNEKSDMINNGGEDHDSDFV